jgi:hypothetical protein
VSLPPKNKNSSEYGFSIQRRKKTIPQTIKAPSSAKIA